MHSRQCRGNADNSSLPSSHTNYRYLSSPVKNERLRHLHQLSRASGRQLKRLQEKLEAATETHGLDVDEGLRNSLKEIMMANSGRVGSELTPGSFPTIFWQQQQEAALKKDLRGMRWHPLMVKWCLYLRHCSSGAYETLRKSRVLTLPSQRTLRDYTYAVKASSGFSTEGDRQLMEAACVLTCPEYEKNVIITMDEMHVKEDLVFDKHTGAMVGFVNLGDINQHLRQFEQSLQLTPSDVANLDTLAKSMLVIMVRGLFSRLNYPYAQFPCVNLSGDVLFDPLWEAVMRLER